MAYFLNDALICSGLTNNFYQQFVSQSGFDVEKGVRGLHLFYITTKNFLKPLKYVLQGLKM
jgi:hypothetical protein